MLAGDGGQEDGLGCFAGLQVLDVRLASSGGFEARLDLIGLLLSCCNFVDGELDEFLQYELFSGVSSRTKVENNKKNKRKGETKRA